MDKSSFSKDNFISSNLTWMGSTYCEIILSQCNLQLMNYSKYPKKPEECTMKRKISKSALKNRYEIQKLGFQTKMWLMYLCWIMKILLS